MNRFSQLNILLSLKRRIQIIILETYQLSGFDEFATIPITYPRDICLMEVSGQLYAVCLANKHSQNRNETILKVLRKVVSFDRRMKSDVN